MTGQSVKLVNNKRLKPALKPTKQHSTKHAVKQSPAVIQSDSDDDSIDLSDAYSSSSVDADEYDDLHGEQSDNDSGDELDQTDGAADSTDKFADTVSSLLKQDTVTTIQQTLQQQRLKRQHAAEADDDTNERQELLEQRRLKQRRLEKRLLMNKDHVIPEYTINDRLFVKIATRGVVQLFNAISKQQKIVNDAKRTLDKKELKKSVVGTKDNFLKLLKQNGGADSTTVKTESDDSSSDDDLAGNGVKSEDAESADDDDEDIETDRKPVKSGWSVLSDTYMLGGNKMRDWSSGSSSASDNDGND